MSIVPHRRTPAPSLPTATPARPGRHWAARVYPGELSQTSWVRADLRGDLCGLAGLTDDLAESMTLCVSEMFANGVDHSRSGEAGGRIIRTLSTPDARTVRLGIVDDGVRESSPSTPRIPCQRTAQEWEEAERGRGLLLIDALATSWDTRAVVDFPFCEGLGTLVWAEFSLPPLPALTGSEAVR
ncbi:anti-sigma regulatory factor (Ser/Thr protein kinase) [Nocardiopsis arvandica]|uniref:Anti-sigma regulatory factor (Ser/Thr protein kinase) n=1 Tax=Nocardiopsis sinuspersici TaxID=501010 RepID=A0A7Y9X752_9ACTN|nr:ATP-binding protein [Nocardiopsis sinuspersici]NYH50441.1 anti-sigma regulatory factor (Ser/Thr protein kinase) [Nocardiopsis sinuspersici]